MMPALCGWDSASCRHVRKMLIRMLLIPKARTCCRCCAPSCIPSKIKAHMTITQSEVNERFGMLVPVFADFGSGMMRIGQVAMVGNATRNVDVILPSQPKKMVLNAYKDILER